MDRTVPRVMFRTVVVDLGVAFDAVMLRQWKQHRYVEWLQHALAVPRARHLVGNQRADLILYGS